MVTIAICEDEPRFAEELREKTDRYLTERGLAVEEVDGYGVD